jgi:hypothetical protein
LRRDVVEPRLLYWTLVVAFVIGLAAHVGGYLLRLGPTLPLLGLGADLLYTLGWALWTGAVVVAITQIFPEAKRRQIARWLADYEAARRASARADNASVSGDSGAPAAS